MSDEADHFRNPPKKLGNGRPKGSLNRANADVRAIVEANQCNPVESLCAIINRDHLKLGFPDGTIKHVDKDGLVTEEEIIKVDHVLQASKTLMEYMFTKRKAVQISQDDEGGPLQFKMEVNHIELIETIKSARGEKP